MPRLFTPEEIIAIAKLSQFYQAQDISHGALFGARLDPRWARMLYTERKSLEWAYNQDHDFENIRWVANYVYSLCYKGIQASDIINGGGGTIVPITPIGTPAPIIFKVDANSPIPTDGDTLVLPPTWAGFDLQLFRDGYIQYDINVGGTWYEYNKGTKTLTLHGVATLGELFSIWPVI